MQQLLTNLANEPSPTPLPGLRDGLTQDMITPGTLGFLMTAFIVVLSALLIVDMVRRVRRVRYRGELAEAAEAAEAEAAEREAAAAAGTAPAGSGDRAAADAQVSDPDHDAGKDTPAGR